MRLSTIAAVGGSGGKAPPETVSYLVIAGGGGSGNVNPTVRASAGAGAGGYRNSYASESSGGGASTETVFSVSAGTAYTVTVGGGGALDGQGGSSQFASISAVGGGAAGWQEYIPIYGGNFNNFPGHPGGSGGGAGGTVINASLQATPIPYLQGGSGTANQGYPGGNGAYPGPGGGAYGSGAGGGAGGAGTNASGLTPGVAGPGLPSYITGSNVIRATGGSMGYTSTPGGVNGAVNSGDGADGVQLGGSGVVILRYQGADPTIGAGLAYTLTTDGTDSVLVFTSGSDTITW